MTAVSSTLGVTAQPHDPCAALLASLASRKLLLILDNCEHVIETAAELAERIVNEAPEVHVLSTSRESLRTDREFVYLLTPLESPPDHPGLTVAEALQYPAPRLFIERAIAAGYCRDLSNSDASTIADICRKRTA
jgi:predicted ATPase